MRVLRDILKEMAGRYRWQPAEALLEIETVWPDVLGDPLARVARPVGFLDGELTVAVPAPVWSQELWYVRSALMERLNAALSAATVTGVRFVVRPAEAAGADGARGSEAVERLRQLAQEIRADG